MSPLIYTFPGRHLRKAGLLLALLHGAWAGLPPAQAQEAFEEQRYTYALVGISLEEALHRLLDETRLSLAYDSDLVEGRTTFCKVGRALAEDLLACVLRGTGLDYARLSSGTYVLIEDPYAGPRYASLAGQVLDVETGMPLARASVWLPGEHKGTATNQDGRFAFVAIRPGPHRLVVRHVAYHDAADTVHAEPGAHDQVAIRVRPRVVLAAPVVVSGFEARRPSDELGAARRSTYELEAIPHVAGDVLHGLEAVAGVRRGEALANVHVQGGASSEQLFLLDGVPVFMPVSTGGLVGLFSPFATSGVAVQKAGFGASHGSGLSGVIDVRHDVAPHEHAQLTAQVDPLSLNARWNSRAALSAEAEARWMVALRRGLWDVYEPARLESTFRRWATPDPLLFEVLRPAEERSTAPGEAPEGPLEVAFNDVHAAARIRLSGLRSVELSLYRGANAFGLDEPAQAEEANEDVFEEAYRWRNRTARGRYEWVATRRLFMNASLWSTDYRLSHPVGWDGEGDPSRAIAADDFNTLSERGVRIGGDFAASARHQLSGAVEAAFARSAFALSLDPFGTSPAGTEALQPVAWRLAAFAEDRVALGSRTTFTLGARLTYLPEQQRAYAEPRLAVQYDRAVGAHASWAMRWAVGLYRQYTHAFDVATYNVTALLPQVRFWLPIGRSQRPPEAYHATAAFLYRPDPAWQASAEVFYKHQPHLWVLDYGEGASSLLQDAEGYAYGGALSLSRTGEAVRLEARYEAEVARRRVENRFGGAYVSVPWSAPHRLYLALDGRLRPRWTLTLRGQRVMGRSWGFRQAYYDFLEAGPHAEAFPPYDFSDPASHRLPTFARWDVGLAYDRPIRGVGVQGRVSMVNVLGRRNVTDWSLRYEATTETYARHARHAAGFIPSFALRLTL